ncbi:MAG: nucleoside-diphosphate-sugar epimerase [Gemmatimonadetes bacterium]|nr:nucleoside-diphosphate-sugar epimerase [Gemmatimonadota bacterium]
MSKVLVTGGAGFIGSHVAERFLRDGHEVHLVDDLSTGKRENVPAGATLHVHDIRSPEAATLVREGAFHTMVHLAAQMDVRRSVADPVLDAGINIIGSLNLLEALRASGRAADTRVVFSSTGGVIYGDWVTPPNSETVPKDPESPYAIAKLGVEHYLAYYNKVHGFDAVALRYGNVYGPRQDPHGEAGVVAIFCGRILEGRPLTVFGDGEQTRDYVFVADVADATFRAAVLPLPDRERLDSRAFNVGTGKGTSVNELARHLIAASGRDVPIENAPRRAGEQQHSFISVDKASMLLDWRPTTQLSEGLAESFRWFAARHARGSAGA